MRSSAGQSVLTIPAPPSCDCTEYNLPWALSARATFMPGIWYSTENGVLALAAAMAHLPAASNSAGTCDLRIPQFVWLLPASSCSFFWTGSPVATVAALVGIVEDAVVVEGMGLLQPERALADTRQIAKNRELSRMETYYSTERLGGGPFIAVYRFGSASDRELESRGCGPTADRTATRIGTPISSQHGSLWQEV